MKNVLMIAYSFPPAGGPGVQRTSKFVKYLRNYGWEPVVLTRDDVNMPLRDESLIKDIPDNTKIIRTKAWDLTPSSGIIGLMGKFISRKLLIPDSERLWEIFSGKTAEKVIESHNIQLIYTTSLPYSSHLMAIHLKKKYPHIPWVADFRDEWTNNPYILDNPYNPIRMSIERKMEKKVLRTADCLITNTPIMLKNFLENNRDITDLKDRFFVIPNGYDPDDFKHVHLGPSSAISSNDSFTITYTGSFYGRRKPDIFF
jgi:glycosyltransferase involved in cell wall biosynthesis